MIKQEDAPAAAAIDPSVATACGHCEVEERLLLHYVSHRGIIRRLCTTCVLRLHPQSFCPSCFQVYPSLPSNDAVLTCVKCSSSSHTHCVATGPTASPSPYLCPLCVNPRTPIFKLKTAKEVNANVGEGLNVESEECKVIDRDVATKLLAAATIASASMNKAVVAAQVEAEKRAEEANFARKRAKEALEHMAHLVTKDKLRKKEATSVAFGDMAGSVRGNVGYVGGGFIGPKLNGTGASMVVEEKINTMGNPDRVINSNQAFAAQNPVELRESAKMGSITSHAVILNDDEALMDIDETGRVIVNEGDNGDQNDVDHQMFADMETGEDNVNVQGERQDDASAEVVLVQTAADHNHQMHHTNSNGGERHANSGGL